jgi:hypothetical protein
MGYSGNKHVYYYILSLPNSGNSLTRWFLSILSKHHSLFMTRDLLGKRKRLQCIYLTCYFTIVPSDIHQPSLTSMTLSHPTGVVSYP